MTIIQLEYLLAVANCGSFSQAAEHCFVTQPSLSMQVKSLEEELGVVLLDRSKKPVIPTEAGEVVLAQARETLRAYDCIREAVAELKGETAGKLRLGVIPTIAPYLLHKFIPAFVRDFPKVELEISEMITADIVEALKRDRIDAALVASGTCGEGIQEQELFNDRFYAYVSPENPLYERSNVRIEDIDVKDLVILSAGNCMRDQIIELCQAKREMPSHYSFESGSLDTLMRIVDCTSCLTIVPEMAVEFIPADRRDRLKPLAKGATSRKIAVAVRRTYVKSSIIRALTETILARATPRPEGGRRTERFGRGVARPRADAADARRKGGRTYRCGTQRRRRRLRPGLRNLPAVVGSVRIPPCDFEIRILIRTFARLWTCRQL